MIDPRQHLGDLWRYALVLMRDPDQAEDLVQEALVRAMEGAHTWQPSRDLRPWLLAIFHNTHVSRRRRHRVELAASDADLAPVGAMAPQQLERVHFNETIAALMTLPEEQREALVLVALEGLSYRDAASILGIPVGTLMSRLARGREALRVATDSGAKEPGAAAAPRPGLRVVR